MSNAIKNLKNELAVLVERKDTVGLRLLLVAYLGHRRHETMIRLAIANVERSVKVWSERR